MPRFALETNVPLKEIPEDFLSTCIQTIAKMTNKPEMFIVAYVQPNQDMYFGNSDGPCGIANISSIGYLGVEDNKKFCNTFYKLIEEYVGIPRSRLWLTFTENLPEYVTFKGRSFYHISMCRAPGEKVIHDPDE
ncbi:macrophage migration inhibitory factor homolog [Planococcus citri]|uniref:macrophage migration inhibitory factor homolog n=1 Tax=Planococcus citri TaxID=170843 RepID=UPI0031F922BC